MTSDESSYRVVNLPISLRTAYREARDIAETTNRSFLAASVTRQLPGLVDELVACGLEASSEETKPTRFEVTQPSLVALQEASERTGVAMTELMRIVLTRQATEVGKPPVKKAAKKRTPKKPAKKPAK